MKNIFILDDEKAILDPLSIWLKNQGYSVEVFTTSTTLLECMSTKKPDLILVDICLYGEDGRQVCSLLKVKYRDRIPVILFSATPSLGANFREYDADAFIEKPLKLPLLRSLVHSYLS